MKNHAVFLALGIAATFTGIFFYKTLFFGLLPFPGDLLVAEFKPWRTYSYLGYIPASVPNKAQYPDTIRQTYPWKTLVIKMLKQGQVPLWNPYNFSGSPLLANFQSSALYPFNIFYFIFSQPIAWSILVTLQPLLAVFFTYWYCRKLSVSPLASWFAAISFAYGSFMRVWLEYNTVDHVVLWLPLILLSIESLRIHPHWKWLAVLIGSLTATLLAGHPQIAAYMFLFTIIYFLLRCRSVKHFKLVTILLMLPIGIAAVQLLPGIELVINSARSNLPFSTLFHKILIQPWQLIMLVIPDFFGNPATRTYWLSDTYIGKTLSIGIVPLFFLFATLRSLHPLKKLFLATAGIVFILITANPISYTFYRIPLPIFSTSSPTLISFLFSFSLSMLIAFGVDQFRSEAHTLKKWKKRALQVAGVLSLLWLVVLVMPKISSLPWRENLSMSIRPMILASGLVAITLIAFYEAIANPKRMTTILVLLLGVHVLDLFVAFHKFNPFSPKEFVFPDTAITSVLKKQGGMDRFWGYGTAALEANIATQLALYSPDGYDPLYPRWYGEFITSSQDGHITKQFTTQTRSDASVAPGFGKDLFMKNTYRLRVLDSLGVKHILDRLENGSTDSTFPKNIFSLIYDKDGWKIYQNLTSLPRVALLSNYAVYSSKKEFEKLFFDATFDPLKTVLLDEQIPFHSTNNQEKGKVEVLEYEPNMIRLRTSTAADRFLYISDVYYPGWKAFIDGQSKKIYRANYAFRAVPVSGGTHIVTMVYDPDSLRWGWYISSLSVVLFVAAMVWLRRNYADKP